jgi:hypothetical protein
MLVVEINSIGPEILFLTVPAAKECFVVKLLEGIGVFESELEAPLFRFIVKALESAIFPDYTRFPDLTDNDGVCSAFSQRECSGV